MADYAHFMRLVIFVTHLCWCLVENRMAAGFNVVEASGIEAADCDDDKHEKENETVSGVTKLIRSSCCFAIFTPPCR